MMNITLKDARMLAGKFGIDLRKIPLSEWHYALNVELEHGTKYGKVTNITNNDLDMTARIAIAHLHENIRYYKYLQQMQSRFD